MVLGIKAQSSRLKAQRIKVKAERKKQRYRSGIRIL
jgi:hypothetical protein